LKTPDKDDDVMIDEDKLSKEPSTIYKKKEETNEA
jgi:hypothetical protein